MDFNFTQEVQGQLDAFLDSLVLTVRDYYKSHREEYEELRKELNNNDSRTD